MNYKSGLLLCVALLYVLTSCSPTGSVADSEREAETESIFPEWYQDTGFVTDSVYISTFATAISSDSLQAIVRAEEQARYNLESRVGEKLEKVRNQLEENGSSHARNADFILTLRNAHEPVEEKAELKESTAKQSDNYFRGFAKVSISIEDVKNILKAGFAGKASFWAELSESDSFSLELE